MNPSEQQPMLQPKLIPPGGDREMRRQELFQRQGLLKQSKLDLELKLKIRTNDDSVIFAEHSTVQEAYTDDFGTSGLKDGIPNPHTCLRAIQIELTMMVVILGVLVSMPLIQRPSPITAVVLLVELLAIGSSGVAIFNNGIEVGKSNAHKSKRFRSYHWWLIVASAVAMVAIFLLASNAYGFTNRNFGFGNQNSVPFILPLLSIFAVGFFAHYAIGYGHGRAFHDKYEASIRGREDYARLIKLNGEIKAIEIELGDL